MLNWALDSITVIEHSQWYWRAVQFYGLYPIVTSLIWIVTALIYFYHRDLRGEPLKEGDALPFVSILIPAYCEEASIGRSLEGLVRLDYPNYEIIVINDGSPDRTAEKVKPYLMDPRVRFVDKRVNEGKAMAMNDAIPCARGEFVLIMDADSIPDPAMIRYMVAHFQHPNVGAVAGNPRVRNRSNLLAKLQAVEFSSVIGLMRRAQRVWGQVMCVPGVCGLFRKSAIVEAGMFSPGMATEDIDLTWKLQMSGYDVRYEARALVWMEVPESVKVLWKQRTRWALGLGQVLRRHVRVLWTRRFMRLYPIFIESFLSVVWAWIFVALTAFWVFCFAVGHNPLGGSLIPNYWGLLLFLCCLLQLSCGVWVDSKYDPELPPELYVSVFYPSFYWMLMATSSCFYTTKGMLRRLDLKSPTRWRIQRSQDADAAA